MIQWNSDKTLGQTPFGVYVVGKEGIILAEGKGYTATGYLAVVGLQRQFIAVGLDNVDKAVEIAEKDYYTKVTQAAEVAKKVADEQAKPAESPESDEQPKEKIISEVDNK